jgi:hypothetical protein
MHLCTCVSEEGGSDGTGVLEKKKHNFFPKNMRQITLKSEEQREQFQELQLQFSALRKQLVSAVAQVCFLERIRCEKPWCGSLRVSDGRKLEGQEEKKCSKICLRRIE